MTKRISQASVLLLLAAGCNLLAGPQQTANSTLWPLQVAIESELSTADVPGDQADSGRPQGNSTVDLAGSSIAVAVLAVVDSSALGQAGENTAAGQAPDSEALRRERLVHQAISSALVSNALIEVIQPEQASLDKARTEIVAVNSAALSAPTAKELGSHLGADVLVCALIDREGAEVNVVAQRASDGKLVYHETIKDWDVVASPSAATE